jgi:peptidoglycan hydrolase CwlO-like protein
MKTRHKNIIIASVVLVFAVIGIGLALHIRDAATQTKEAAQEEIHKTGDDVRNKIDKASEQIAEDYKTAKEKTKAAADKAKEAYTEWKEKNKKP